MSGPGSGGTAYPSPDARLIADTIKAGLREIAESILEAAKEQHRTDDPDRVCNTCGSYAHWTSEHVCEDCNGQGHEDKYDEACPLYEAPEPYRCRDCGREVGQQHNTLVCNREGIVAQPSLFESLLASFPFASTKRGGIRFPTTPDAPPPELPTELHLAPVPKPDVKVGDEIRFGDLTFRVTDIGKDGRFEAEMTHPRTLKMDAEAEDRFRRGFTCLPCKGTGRTFHNDMPDGSSRSQRCLICNGTGVNPADQHGTSV